MPEPFAAHPSHEMLLPDLYREIPAHEAARIREHLAQCVNCQAESELLRRSDAAMAEALRPDPVLNFADRLLARLHAQAERPTLRRPQAGWLVAAAAAVLLMAGGAGLQWLASRPAAPPQGLDQVYILLLYQNVAELKSLPPEPARARAQEYIEWGQRLRREGRYVSAARLRDTPGVIVAPGGEALPGPPVQGDLGLTGYYVVRARDEADATAVAQAGPHSKYGTIAVRRIR